jgi:hypothetical protein
VRNFGSSVENYRKSIDLPHANVLQGYFLSKAFAAKNVFSYGEVNKCSEQPVIKILPNHAIWSCHDVDVLLSFALLMDTIFPHEMRIHYLCVSQ